MKSSEVGDPEEEEATLLADLGRWPILLKWLVPEKKNYKLFSPLRHQNWFNKLQLRTNKFFDCINNVMTENEKFTWTGNGRFEKLLEGFCDKSSAWGWWMLTLDVAGRSTKPTGSWSTFILTLPVPTNWLPAIFIGPNRCVCFAWKFSISARWIVEAEIFFYFNLLEAQKVCFELVRSWLMIVSKVTLFLIHLSKFYVILFNSIITSIWKANITLILKLSKKVW